MVLPTYCKRICTIDSERDGANIGDCICSFVGVVLGGTNSCEFEEIAGSRSCKSGKRGERLEKVISSYGIGWDLSLALDKSDEDASILNLQ